MSLEQLTPGDAIQLADATQLAAFEDVVANEIDPRMTDPMWAAWAGRVALRDLIRPPNFNGTIASIELLVMDEPYARFVDAIDRGWKFPRGFNHRLIEDKEMVDSFRGFTLLAEAKSSGRGIIGQIQAELWYSRVSNGRGVSEYITVGGEPKSQPRHKKNVASNAGASVRRHIVQPKIERTKFMELHKTSRRVGFKALRDGMMHPIVQPTRR